MLQRSPERLSYAKREDIIDLPNLIEVQIKSYQTFLQSEALPEERANEGLEEVFQEIFPIHSYDDKILLEYMSYTLGVPKYGPEECIRRGITYSATLKVRFRLTDETGIKEEEVYMGELPLMTDKGTFVINGAERVIVSQLHRSPGICFEQEMHPKGHPIYSFRVIPYRGSWLEALLDPNDMVYIYVDRKKRRKKILATTFVRSLGYSTNADIIEEFFETASKKLRTEKDITKLVGTILAVDIVDQEKEILYGRAGEKLTTAMLKRILDAGIHSVKIAVDATEASPIMKMLAKDPTNSYESALKEFYKKIRPGEPATLNNARSAIMRLFFDPRRYNLGKVGRYKINTKLGFSLDEEELQHVTLTKQDVVESLKYLIGLKERKDNHYVDDIDHLGNRRVRSVGELIQNQCRIGLARMERIIRERMNLFDFTTDTLTPGKIVSPKGLSGVLKDFFGRSQLSQFMDQTNPVSELTHKRRLSSLGPGGLNRDRAGYEVRDVHSSHYGRVCPIETPEGPNIGLITSLSTFAKINDFGFIETPYRIVKKGRVTDEIEYMTATQEEEHKIAQASSDYDETRIITSDIVWGRHRGETLQLPSSEITHMDVSPKQLISIVTGLIPFLEHDDANRALMGSNMQRQAVPLVQPRAPFVGTGLEKRAAQDTDAVIVAIEDGKVEYVDSQRIIVNPTDKRKGKREYQLKKFMRSNAGTCINQTPICHVGDKIYAGDIIADGPATEKGELALGRNVLVAFMPWKGYNFEDAIIISEKLLKEDYYTSVHIEEFEVSARDTKLGKEEITRDIPNIPEDALANLGDDGIIQIGSEVKAGDILVGKITPKTETELAPEERLLRAIFGEKAADVRDASLYAPPGTDGVVMGIKVFTRKDRFNKTDDELLDEASRITELQTNYKQKIKEAVQERHQRLGALLLNDKAPGTIIHRKTADVLIEEKTPITESMIELIETQNLEDLVIPENSIYSMLRQVMKDYEKQVKEIETYHKKEMELIRKGDTDLEPGVIHQVKVYVATKRKLQPGDKMAGRHGNKGVVSVIVPESDMPYLEDGRTVEIILNPLGVPSRMNIGQLLETHLGLAAEKAGIYVQAPVFEGFPEEKIWDMMQEHCGTSDGKFYLYDGQTGDRFDNPTTVGQIYMLKLIHLAADKLHARSVGPYSLVTQQPLGGKAQRGGQRFGEMEVWALEAYGVSHLLQEMLTVKSDDVEGRTRIYESIVKGENFLKVGTPESFNVLKKELQGLCLDVTPHSSDEE